MKFVVSLFSTKTKDPFSKEFHILDNYVAEVGYVEMEVKKRLAEVLKKFIKKVSAYT